MLSLSAERYPYAVTLNASEDSERGVTLVSTTDGLIRGLSGTTAERCRPASVETPENSDTDVTSRDDVDVLVHSSTLWRVPMSRRAVLKIAAATPAVLGLGAGLNAAVLALSPALASEATGLKIPASTRLRGVNIVPTFDAGVIPADQHSPWSTMWRVWNWNGWIKPQIDDAAAIGNAIRFFGNTHCIAQGNITQATYLAQWRQVLDYSLAKGLFIYPCGGDLGHWGNFTWAQSVALYTAWAKTLSTYSNVVGVDITNEAWGQMSPANVGPTTYNQPESYVDLLAALGGIVRGEAGVPIAHSFPLADSSWWTLSTDPDPHPVRNVRLPRLPHLRIDHPGASGSGVHQLLGFR